LSWVRAPSATPSNSRFQCYPKNSNWNFFCSNWNTSLTAGLMELTLFGIGKAEWELYNSFSNWVSAFATLAAVLVSLHLARRSGRPRAKVSVSLRLIITPGSSGKIPHVISFSIVNTGDRVIRVTSIGWQVGFWKKRYAYQSHDPGQSSEMPIELSHGQEASWSFPTDFGDDPWPDYFRRKVMSPNFWLSRKTLRAYFQTSVGETFVTRPNASVLGLLDGSGKAK
jgi:hypothetical protein